ncbi:MAG: transcription elongation factor subunit Spt4 [Nanoarchaeota archaeon]
MAVQRACKSCKSIFEGAGRCPSCGGEENTETFKGKIVIVNPETSEIAKNLKYTKKGSYAVKLG